MYHYLRIEKYYRPLSYKQSKDLIKNMIDFKDSLSEEVIAFCIKSSLSILNATFNEQDNQYKLLREHQQEIIDVTLASCIDHILHLLNNKIFQSSKTSEIEIFILDAIILNKSRKFNLRLVQILSNKDFGHKHLVNRNQAIKTLKRKN